MPTTLPDSSAIIDALCEASKIGLVVIDRDLRFVRISRMLAALNGLAPAEHVGRPLAEVIPPEIAPLIEAAARRVFETGKPAYDVEIVTSLGGIPHYWRNHFLPLQQGGVVTAVAVLVIEHSAQRHAEQALRKSEAQFRTISETAPIGIFLTDALGSSVYTNRVNAEQMGISVEETRGDGWERAVHPEDRARVSEAFYAATLERRPYRGVNRYLHADGRVVFVDVKANGVYDGESLLGYVGVAEDITDRLAAEEERRENEMRFRQLAENIDAVFWLASADHEDILYISPSFERIWGRPGSTFSKVSELLETIYPDDRPLLQAAASNRTERFEIQYRIVRPDGTIRWIADRGFPVRDERGVIIRQAGIASDITQQKLLEAQLLQSQKLDSIGRLAGGIAHDFNNLLGVIQPQLAFVAQSLESSELGERLRHAELAATHAADLTRHLLAFARRQEIRPAVLDLNDLVTGVESLLRRMIGDDVDVVLRLDPDLTIVRADPTQLEQVLVNLVANARVAMPSGGMLTIATRSRSLEVATAAAFGVAAGTYAELSVTDTGAGIPERHLPHLFEPFFTTREAAGGTGLGLSIAYGIVRQCGGAITVESTEGAGTTILVYLPRIETPPSSA